MSTKQILTGLYLDKRRKTNQGKYPVKLRITHKNVRKYYSLGLYATSEEWKTITSSNPRGRLKALKDNSNLAVQKATSFINSMNEEFSFTEFERKYINKSQTGDILLHLFQLHINQLNVEGRISSGECYYNAISSLRRFHNSVHIQEITPKFLTNYESWMISNGNSLTTVGIYLRSLRTIINIAKEQQIISPNDYPFGKRKYQIPQGRNIKKAVDIEEIGKIFHHKSVAFSALDKAKDFWIFSYLANGMNIKDICRLKYKNLVNGMLVFERAKTQRLNRGTPILITVIVHPLMEKII